MHLRNPSSLDRTIEALKRVVSDADTVLSTWPVKQPGYIDRAKSSYLQWVESASVAITNYLDDEDLLAHLRAHGFGRIYDLTEEDARPFPLVQHEVHLQQRRLNAVIAYLERLKPFVDREGSIVVPDTSAFIQGRDFREFDWTSLDVEPLPVRLVVPVLVIEELEKVKCYDRANGHVAGRVLKELRQVLRSIAPGDAAQLRRDVTIEAFVDEDDHRRLENHDGEIIDQAAQIQALTGRNVTIVSLDLPMELRARLRGVQAMTMPAKNEMTKLPTQAKAAR